MSDILFFNDFKLQTTNAFTIPFISILVLKFYAQRLKALKNNVTKTQQQIIKKNICFIV